MIYKITPCSKPRMTRAASGSIASPRKKCSWRQSWEIIGGKRNYYRSSWEVNYAHYLEFLRKNGDITDWEHEPDTFWFEKIKRGVRSYTPDFKVTENSGDVVYHEVKGWMDAKSKTKLKRMKKYHPDINLTLVDAGAYKKMCHQCLGVIPGWK